MSATAIILGTFAAAIPIALAVLAERKASRRGRDEGRPAGGPRFEPGWTQVHDKRNGYSYGREMPGSEACPSPEDVRTMEQEGAAFRPWTGG